MKRVRLPFAPCWEGAILGYSIKAIRGAYPRLAAHYEFDDLLQDAYVIYRTCELKYVDGSASGGYKRVDNAAWFMSLFKVCLTNHLRDQIRSVAKYSYFEDDRAEVPTFDIGIELYDFAAGLTDDLRIVLRDLVRPVSRFRFTRQDVVAVKEGLGIGAGNLT